MISNQESECTKEVLNYIYDLRDYFDFNDLEHYKLFCLIIYNNLKDQENTLLEHETDNVLAQIIAKLMVNDLLDTYPSKKEEYYNHLVNEFDISNIQDYRLLLYFYLNYKQTQSVFNVFENIVNQINALTTSKNILNDSKNYCECCGITQWQNMPIRFILYKDKKTNNIVQLCPNCYSQQE